MEWAACRCFVCGANANANPRKQVGLWLLLHLAVVEKDHARVSVVLLLHLVLGVDALPLDLRTVQGHVTNQ